ncbi:MAG TPA: hypothetical protein VMU94_16910 [Streptosporangiaceae bacterium]|nr:hypothetical protein [Streptosporangiaceae bacterium]
MRSFYWDEALSAPLPLGQIAARGLIHHEELAILTPDLAQADEAVTVIRKHCAVSLGMPAVPTVPPSPAGKALA